MRHQARYLVDFWDALVKVRPEFGRLTKTDRLQLRGSSIAGTAISIHGVIAVADVMFRRELPFSILNRLDSEVVVDGGKPIDYFSYDNPVWQKIGVLVPATDTAGDERKQLRMDVSLNSGHPEWREAELKHHHSR